jgi:hypothetical protein
VLFGDFSFFTGDFLAFFPLSLSASGLCPSALYQVQGAVFHSLAASSDRLLLDKKRRDFSPVQPYVPKD